MAAKTDHPQTTIPIPDSAFQHPTPEERARNETYFDGYDTGRMATDALPSPAGSKTYEIYRTWVDPFLMPTTTSGYVNNEAVGYNNAMIDGANWLWTNDPKSPHKIPPS